MAGEGFVEGRMAVWFRGTDFEGGWRGWEKEVGFVEKLQYVTYWENKGDVLLLHLV